MVRHRHSAVVLIPKILAALILVAALASCAKRQALKFEPSELPAYEGAVTLDALKNSSALRTVGSVGSEVTVLVTDGRGRRAKYRGAMLYEHPGRLRLRVYGPLGSTVVEIVHSDRLLQVYLPQRRTLYEGNTPSGGKKKVYSMDEEEGRYVLHTLTVMDDGTLGLAASHIYDRRTLLNTAVRVYNGGEEFIRVRFGNFAGRTPMAARVDFYNGYAIEIALEEPEFEAEVNPVFFEPIHPGGKRVLPLDLLVQEATP